VPFRMLTGTASAGWVVLTGLAGGKTMKSDRPARADGEGDDDAC
jgi:hypothetical protein